MPKFGNSIEVDYQYLSNDNKDLLNSFSCGNEVIDEYIKKYCLNDYSSVTHIIVNSVNKEIICVYTLCCSSMILESYSKHYPTPAVELKFFAVDKKYQDMPYSEDKEDGCLSNVLLSEVTRLVMDFTDDYCGANLLVVYSTDEGVPFYKKNGFRDFPEIAWRDDSRFLDGCTPLFLTLREVVFS